MKLKFLKKVNKIVLATAKRKESKVDAKFGTQIKQVLHHSREEALRIGNDYIDTEHVFLGILNHGENVAIEILSTFDIDLREMKEYLESKLKPTMKSQNENKDSFPLMKSVERVLKMIYLEARGTMNPEADASHLILAILKDKNSFVTQMLNANDINYDIFKSKVMEYANRDEVYNVSEEDTISSGRPGKEKSEKQTSNRVSDTPILDSYGVDLTRAAIENKLDPVVGRNNEIERVVQILSRRKKNNPVLIGDPGVGKSAIVEGLALRIIQKKVSRVLFDKRIVSLDLPSIVAGTKYRGQFEERMKSIINELTKNSNVILFIDELHTMVGAGGASGALDAANILKPALARGEIQCIGATTLDEYRQHIEKDGALERRFQKIIVDPTSTEETLEILNNIKERYEDHHHVRYTPEALKACVALTHRYISDRHNPDKAIDALDEAGARVHITNIQVPKRIDDIEKQLEITRLEKIRSVKNQNFELAASYRDGEQDMLRLLEDEKKKWETDLLLNRQIVDEVHVEQVIAMMTGIPVNRIALAEGVKLLKMEELLTQKVVGQSEAILQISKAIKRNRAGLKDPNKPIGTFIFLGPTGVGKTQLAKVLAEYLFDSADTLVRIDMSEYMEKFSVSRLVGAPPGYVGYEEGGQLTEKVRRRPYSVVLFDEIEKAHPDVFNLLLQLLDEGILTDSLGRRIDFKNTVIIMTSNIGSRQVKDFGRGVGFESANALSREDSNKAIISKELEKRFAPEFLNRIDDIVLFNSLSREDIHKIIDIELKHLYDRVEKLNYKMIVSIEAKDFIAEKGMDVKYGARPLKRAIQRYLEDKMADVIIQSSLVNGDLIFVGLDEKKENILVEIRKEDDAQVALTDNATEQINMN